eukprot:TRINITY_DN37668_c0_g1_i1.p1 TRINITY_DN37668_c0_g1~~TRINITY_DN37668_c0_g1_i1.p1  ORF type:complete len:145 (+),score=31.26 TRINITY_DN37668_c0_g1_i1:117-551(+)
MCIRDRVSTQSTGTSVVLMGVCHSICDPSVTQPESEAAPLHPAAPQDPDEITLVYPPVRGAAEPLRMLLRYAGISYQDSLAGFESLADGGSELPVLAMPGGSTRIVGSSKIAEHIARAGDVTATMVAWMTWRCLLYTSPSPRDS